MAPKVSRSGTCRLRSKAKTTLPSQPTEFCFIGCCRQICKERSPKARPDVHRARPDVHRERPDVHRARPDVPKTRPDVHRERPDVSRASPDVPRARPDVHRARPDVHRARPDVPRARPSMPRARPGVHRGSSLSRRPDGINLRSSILVGLLGRVVWALLRNLEVPGSSPAGRWLVGPP